MMEFTQKEMCLFEEKHYDIEIPNQYDWLNQLIFEDLEQLFLCEYQACCLKQSISRNIYLSYLSFVNKLFKRLLSVSNPIICVRKAAISLLNVCLNSPIVLYPHHRLLLTFLIHSYSLDLSLNENRNLFLELDIEFEVLYHVMIQLILPDFVRRLFRY